MKTLSNDEASALARPMVYTLVTSLDKNGKPNAMGVSWVTRTSIDPPLILISIAPGRFSHDGIALHKEFVVNYPNEKQAKGAWLCGTKSGRGIDKIKEAGLSLVDSVAVKVPTIADATVAFECKVVDSFVTGDHTVFVGEVVAVRGNPAEPSHIFVNGAFKPFACDKDGKVNLNVGR